MAATYPLIRDYESPDALISMAPMWVVAVVRYKHPATFDKDLLKSDQSVNHMETRPGVLVISSDCTSLTISASKSSHVYTLNAALQTGKVNYLSAMMPGDWLLAWMVSDETQGRALIKELNKTDGWSQLNGFKSGLKFLGRVQSIRRRVTVSRDRGAVNSNFALTGVGFSELDAAQFYEPLLRQGEQLDPALYRLGVALDAIVTGRDKSASSAAGAIDVNKMIPYLVRLIFGDGIYKREQGNGTTSPSPNTTYRVPDTVAKLLGRTASKGKLTFSDMLDIIVGVQKYGANSSVVENSPKVFVPDGLHSRTFSQSVGGGYQHTGKNLLGEFPVFMLPMGATPAWSFLGNYLNSAVNEMYVALRADQNGSITPHLIVRQLPFSSPHKTVGNNTFFQELPRWKVDKAMVWDVDVGRSDALRFNFFHVMGVGPGTALDNQPLQYVNSPPKADSKDIERFGLRPYMKQVNTLMVQKETGPGRERDIIADIVSGQHLMLTGQFTLCGIQAPICPGDNLEFEGVIYHIESVTHVGAIDGAGKRTWQTVIQVSHGQAASTRTDVSALIDQYAGIVDDDAVTYDAPNTVEDDLEKLSA